MPWIGTHGSQPGPPAGGVDPSRAFDARRAVEILSHELRSPITTIQLGTRVLSRPDYPIPQQVRDEVAEAVELEVERLHQLVENLLAVARHEGGGEPLPVGPLLLQRWLPRMLADEVGRVPGLRLTAHVDPRLPPVLADDAALEQALRNVLANAARYAPEGMPVEVRAEPEDDGAVNVRILDRGPGIDPDEAEQLFEPFYRSARTAGPGSAAGLGLAAARRLLVAMGGSIEARPRDGGGAELVVRLRPMIEDDEPD